MKETASTFLFGDLQYPARRLKLSRALEWLFIAHQGLFALFLLTNEAEVFIAFSLLSTLGFWIFFAVLASLKLLASGLRDWHRLCLPEDKALTEPTDAMRYAMARREVYLSVTAAMALCGALTFPFGIGGAGILFFFPTAVITGCYWLTCHLVATYSLPDRKIATPPHATTRTS